MKNTMVRFNKTILLSIIFILSLTMVNALTLTPTTTLNTDESVYQLSLTENNTLKGYYNNNIIEFYTNGTKISINPTTFTLTGSLSGNQLAVDEYFWVALSTSGGANDYYIVFDDSYNEVDQILLAFNYGKTHASYDDTYIYIVDPNSANNFVDVYSNNGIFLYRKNISGIDTNIKSISPTKDNSFLITSSATLYEYSNDFETQYSSVALPDTNDTLNVYSYKDNNDEMKIILNPFQSITTSWEIYDLADLYTSPYNTLNEVNYSKSLCIDSDTFCTNTQYLIDINGDVTFYCDSINNTEYCSDTCENTEVNNVVVGSCTQLGCENDCNVLGLSFCTSGTTYSVCGKFDSDACLEFGAIDFCPANQYCSNEEGVGSQCSTILSGDEYNQDFIRNSLDLVSQTGVVKEEGTSEETKNIVKSVVNFAIPLTALFEDKTTYVLEAFYKDEINETFQYTGFNDVTSNSVDYYAYNCNYEETNIFNDDLEHNNLGGNNWVGSGTINNSATYNYVRTNTQINKTFTEKTNSRIDTIIDVVNDGNHNVSLYNDNNQIITLSITYDSTTFNTLIYETSQNKLLVNATSTSDDLKYIYLGSSVISDDNTGFVEISLIREVLGVEVNENYYSLPLTMNYDPNKIVYTTQNTMDIYQVTHITINDYPQYTKNTDDKKSFDCTHNELECYNVKAYANTQGMSTYHFSDDVQLCVSSLSGGVLTNTPDLSSTTTDDRSTIERVLNTTWNDKDKLFFSSILLLLIFGIFAGASFLEKDGTFVLVGTLISGLLMFYFVLEGFIPAWLIILFAIIGSAIGGVAIRNMTIGRG